MVMTPSNIPLLHGKSLHYETPYILYRRRDQFMICSSAPIFGVITSVCRSAVMSHAYGVCLSIPCLENVKLEEIERERERHLSVCLVAAVIIAVGDQRI